MDEKDLIWNLIKDNFDQARAHEQYRASTVSLVLTIASILVAILAINEFTTPFANIVYSSLIVIGLYGAACSAKHYELNRMHVNIARSLIDKLKQCGIQTPFDLNKHFEDTKSAKNWGHSRLHWLRLNWLWTGFPLLVAAGGLLLLIRSLSAT